MADFSPMMRQYLKLKEAYPNAILFFRLGDFYEMFFNDAKTVSRELELTLTGKECGMKDRAPMCGVPYHSAEGYIAKLVSKGYKVAICEQTEDPKLAKGLVKREVVRVITPGTVMESSMLDETKNNYICSVYYKKQNAGICFADISTGELQLLSLNASKNSDIVYKISNEFARFSPSEIIMNPESMDLTELGDFIRERMDASVECMDFSDYDINAAEAQVCSQFNVESSGELAAVDSEEVLLALAALFSYLKRTQKIGLERMNTVVPADTTVMKLDLNARRNLELTETLRSKEKRGSLLWVLDKTKTSMGKRLIKSWIEQPLMNPAKIMLRQNAVDELYQLPPRLDDLENGLSGIFDIERIITRVVYGSANGRELRALSAALGKVPGIQAQLFDVESTYLKDICRRMDDLEEMRALIDSSIVDEPPFTIREGGIIREGFDSELDALKDDMQGGQKRISSVEASEKEKTGIAKLKIGYNRVFGYYIEVTNSYKHLVPESYIRKQTLTGAERYITPELKEIENHILGAKEKSIAMESRLFEEIRQQVASGLERIQQTAKAVAELDVLVSFSRVALQNDYSKPVVNMSGKLYLKESRHPVVELLIKNGLFVPNNVEMDMNDNRVSIITGPNMAGKSTFMRQAALIVIMAQMGSFVPAEAAEIGIVDAVFTRVGASDDLAAGQSTFMIEMTEVAEILNNASKSSLLIFDEIGRGTSTYDGMSIARAVLEYVQDKKTLGAKTLFATHYHELTELEGVFAGVKNFNVAVKKYGDDITFLRRIIRGGADDSYGIEVAKLAGIPEKVIKRAKEILLNLEETGAVRSTQSAAERFGTEPVQLSLDTKESQVLNKLKNIDVNALTPIESMNILFELANLIKQ